MQDIDVLIVGAGPVGLHMGLCLAKEGIPFQIIDEKFGPTTTSNAVGVNPRTLGIWKTLGFLDEAISRGLKVHGTSMYTEEKRLNKVSFDIIKSDHQFMLSLPQADTEQLLIKQLEAKGHKIEWNSELIELSQTNEYALATYKNLEGNVEYKAKWVIGCDGYRSNVRELSGITRESHDLPLHFLAWFKNKGF